MNSAGRIEFDKFHGLGNDFITIDNRTDCYDEVLSSQAIRQKLCCRRTGIGADGILEMKPANSEGCQVRQVYYNSDGCEGTFCGNGARCFVYFAAMKGVCSADKSLMFEACDGVHEGWISRDSNLVHIRMKDVDVIRKIGERDFFVNTGSPHHVRFVDNVGDVDVKSAGADIRYGPFYPDGGTNVNFVEVRDNELHVRSYERGVEDETLACGTGLTAVCLVNHYRLHVDKGHGFSSTPVFCRGGKATVSYTKTDTGNFKNVTLIGPVCHVYHGVLSQTWDTST